MKMSGLPFCLFIFYRPNEWSLIMIFSLKMGIEAIEMKDTQSSLDWNKFRPAFLFFFLNNIFVYLCNIPFHWFKRAFYIYFLKTSSSNFFFSFFNLIWRDADGEWNGNTNLLLRRHNQSDSHSNIFLARDFYIFIFFFLRVCVINQGPPPPQKKK